MPQCDACGNEYSRSFQIVQNGKTHTFDSFECAIQKLAPRCSHCACTIIGHGLESEDSIYCCAHCAREAGITALVDHA